MATGQRDLRRKARENSDCKVVAMWRDEQGADKFASGRALDVSDVGLRMRMPVAIRIGAYITLRAEQIGVHGQASVRYCTRHGNNFVIGVEFSGGLSRRPKAWL